jgi:hypothetical protein
MNESNTKEDLINELIDIQKYMEKLWEFHPDNPERIMVVDTYNELKRQKDQLEITIELF